MNGKRKAAHGRVSGSDKGTAATLLSTFHCTTPHENFQPLDSHLAEMQAAMDAGDNVRYLQAFNSFLATIEAGQ